MTRTRIAVLASGGGSNLQAILDHLAALGEARHGDVVLVASNRPDAGALVRAERAGIPHAVLRSPLHSRSTVPNSSRSQDTCASCLPT